MKKISKRMCFFFHLLVSDVYPNLAKSSYGWSSLWLYHRIQKKKVQSRETLSYPPIYSGSKIPRPQESKFQHVILVLHLLQLIMLYTCFQGCFTCIDARCIVAYLGVQMHTQDFKMFFNMV